MITIEDNNQKKKFKMLKADLDFHKALEEKIDLGIFKSKTEATRIITPYIKQITAKPIKVVLPKPKKMRWIKNKGRRRRIELELG